MGQFKDLEHRQDRLMQEMDDTISVYLIEMREENDRLLRELSAVKSSMPEAEQTEQQPVIKSEHISENLLEKKPIVPKNVAANVYKQQKRESEPNSTPAIDPTSNIEAVPQADASTLEQQIIAMYKNGQSIEQIAKQTAKGKTEIELLIKFHS